MRGLNRATRGWRSSLQQLRGSLGNLRTDLGGVLGMLAGAGAAVGGFAREASFRTQLVRLGEESKRTPAEMEAYGHTLTAAGVRHGLSRREMLDMSTAAQAKGGVRLDGDLLDTAAQFHIRAGSQDGRQTGEALAIISRMPGDIAANIGGLLGALDAGLFSLSQVQSNLPALVGSFMPTGDIRQAGAFLNIAGLSRPTAPEAVSAAEQVMGDFRSLSKDIRTRFGVNVIDPATGDLRRDIVEAMIELAEKQPSMVELGDIFTRRGRAHPRATVVAREGRGRPDRDRSGAPRSRPAPRPGAAGREREDHPAELTRIPHPERRHQARRDSEQPHTSSDGR